MLADGCVTAFNVHYYSTELSLNSFQAYLGFERGKLSVSPGVHILFYIYFLQALIFFQQAFHFILKT